MSRPRTDAVPLNLRLSRSLKDRLFALAYHEGVRTGDVTAVADVNVSEFVRQLLSETVATYEKTYQDLGKTPEDLRTEVNQALVREQRVMLEQMERSLSGRSQ